MSGLEIAGVIAEVGKQAIHNTSPMEIALAQLAKTEPALQSAAHDVAYRAAVKERVKSVLFRPLGALVGVRHKYFEENFVDDVGRKISAVPEENLQEPPASLVAQVMDGLQYNLDDAELKDMYLNLIASASDNRRGAHASFVSIIRQLDPEEAAWLQKFLDAENIPLVEVRLTSTNPSGWNVHARNVVRLTSRAALDGTQEVSELEVQNMPLWIDNWVRLGLFHLYFDRMMTDEGAYDWVSQRPEWRRALADGAARGVEPNFQRGLLARTDFGAAFRTAVLTPEVVRSPPQVLPSSQPN